MVAACQSDAVVKETKASSVWRLIKERRIDKWHKNPDGSSGTYEATFIQRNDGVSFERTGISREWNETFLCKGSFGEFTFQANRWNETKNKPSSRYVVLLFSPYIEKGKESLCRSMSKDIESALLNMPLHRIHDNIPVDEVVFQIDRGYNPATLKYAWEI